MPFEALFGKRVPKMEALISLILALDLRKDANSLPPMSVRDYVSEIR
jgi:hypothetical protein